MTRRVFTPTLFCMLGCVVMVGGCSTTVIPPEHPPDPVSVYVTDYGRHSSVLLPDPRGHLTEFAYGDWDWFALRQTDSGSAMRALFFSKDSTLGRRQLAVDDRDDVDHITRATKAVHVARIEAARDRVEALLERLDTFYQGHIDTVTYSPNSQLWFVRYPGHYGGFHNCNHVTAGWLRELGCEVHGTAMFSKFTIRAGAANTSAKSSEKLGNRPTYGRAGG